MQGRDPGLRANHVGDLVDVFAVVLVGAASWAGTRQAVLAVARDQKRCRGERVPAGLVVVRPLPRGSQCTPARTSRRHIRALRVPRAGPWPAPFGRRPAQRPRWCRLRAFGRDRRDEWSSSDPGARPRRDRAPCFCLKEAGLDAGAIDSSCRADSRKGQRRRPRHHDRRPTRPARHSHRGRLIGLRPAHGPTDLRLSERPSAFCSPLVGNAQSGGQRGASRIGDVGLLDPEPARLHVDLAVRGAAGIEQLDRAGRGGALALSERRAVRHDQLEASHARRAQIFIAVGCAGVAAGGSFGVVCDRRGGRDGPRGLLFGPGPSTSAGARRRHRPPEAADDHHAARAGSDARADYRVADRPAEVLPGPPTETLRT
jgi:hypothetical protein